MKPLVFSSLSRNDVFMPFYGLLMKSAWVLQSFLKSLKTGLKNAVHHLK